MSSPANYFAATLLEATFLEEFWGTLEQAAAACRVEPAWLVQRVEAGLFPHAECAGGLWRVSSIAINRAARMRSIEITFDAAPELAALVADLLEERDRSRV